MVALERSTNTVRTALLGRAEGSAVRCGVCPRHCCLENGASGWCHTRENQDGVLVVNSYGAIAALGADPIEKKPFYHFYPGSTVLTAGGLSCNFGCPWCQNWEISTSRDTHDWAFVEPVRFVDMARRMDCRGVALSYNEPALSLEWGSEVFGLARARGLYTLLVTNGYLTSEALDVLLDAGLDALNVDIKGDAGAVSRWCGGADNEEVWRTCRQVVRAGLHLETTTLLIPGVNDHEVQIREIAGRIARDLGRNIPWHVTAYHPAGKFFAPATRPESVRSAAALGRAEGLRFVYPGNIPPADDCHTWCPSCMSLLIRRDSGRASHQTLLQGRCPDCDTLLPGRFDP